ncbi:MAG: 3-dehydroquinate synthase [Lentisphaeria bacterium]|nr:3-dehydroquinate synthase [Lentisphaeria bacterium]
MAIYQQKFSVKHQFDVYFTRGLFDQENEVLARALGSKNRKALIFIDANLAKQNPGLKAEILNWADYHKGCIDIKEIKELEGGEAIKNDPNIVDELAALYIKHKICRHSISIVIGGGALLDACGYVSSIVHRGVPLLRIPTTVLSQNDSGVGVKNGINRFGIKNFYGVFSPPGGVINDFNFLQSLPDRDWRSGLAEAFKVAIIKDADFLKYLIDNAGNFCKRQHKAEEEMVKRTAILHLEHIGKGGDPFESGSSRPLDFGHWSAHKLESLTNFSVTHGEAVSIGIALDLYYAAAIGLIKESEAQHICFVLKSIGLPVYHPYLETRFDDIIKGLEEFREHLGGELTIAMPKKLGSRTDLHEMDVDVIRASVKKLEAFYGPDELSAIAG